MNQLTNDQFVYRRTVDDIYHQPLERVLKTIPSDYEAISLDQVSPGVAYLNTDFLVTTCAENFIPMVRLILQRRKRQVFTFKERIPQPDQILRGDWFCDVTMIRLWNGPMPLALGHRRVLDLTESEE